MSQHPALHRVICTVTNDLTYDQRMQRICSSLAQAGFEVLLVGRELPASKPINQLIFKQLRWKLFFRRGFLFYFEYNLRLFFFLLFKKYDILCTVDLDTMPGGCAAAWLRRKKRVFDAHEYFTEVPELVGRRRVQQFWAAVERVFLPKYHLFYTVGEALADIFSKKWEKKFHCIRNVPLPQPLIFDEKLEKSPKILLYQGALNVGRGIESLIEAMPMLPETVQLWLAGEGDLSESLREMARQSPAYERIRFLGFVPPDELKKLTSMAWLGCNLLENRGQSYYFSLANKFFDYVQFGVPGISMAFPEYQKLVAEWQVAVLLPDCCPQKIVETILELLHDPKKYTYLRQQCLSAREVWHWKNEEKKLVEIWEGLAGS